MRVLLRGSHNNTYAQKHHDVQHAWEIARVLCLSIHLLDSHPNSHQCLTHEEAHTHIHTRTHTHARTHTHTYTHIRTPGTHIHTYTHIYTHIHTCTHTRHTSHANTQARGVCVGRRSLRLSTSSSRKSATISSSVRILQILLLLLPLHPLKHAFVNAKGFCPGLLIAPSCLSESCGLTR